MLKIILFSIVSIFFINIAHAQKHFQLTIKLDSSIVPQKIRYNYDDGKTTFFSPDSVNNKTEIVLKGDYFSLYSSFNISYTNQDGVYYSSDFFIGDKPAKINFHYNPNVEQILLYDHVQNAIPIYDTVTNKIYRELTHLNKKENLAAWNFSQKNQKQLYSNNSIRKAYIQMLKSIDKRSMDFIKKYLFLISSVLANDSVANMECATNP